MRPLIASVVFGGLLIASLGAKGLSFAQSDDAGLDDDQAQLAAILDTIGFSVTVSPAGTAPVWITGLRNGCVVQIADVSPHGWFRKIVAIEAQGKHLQYIFKGVSYDEQPIYKTMFEHYYYRVGRYFGVNIAVKRVRAVVSAPTCTEEIVARSVAHLPS